jgi:sulfate adenylyltransferase subunit 1
VLVDATKLDWRDPQLKLLPQTRRHSLLVHLLRVPSIVVAINKLDAVDDPALAFVHIRAQLEGFAAEAGIPLKAVVPISALKGYNVVTAADGWAGYQGPSLLDLLEHLPNTAAETELPFSFAVQWVEKFSASSDTSQGRRVFWGRVATGGVQVGQTVRVLQGPQGLGQTATVAQVLDHARQPHAVQAGHSAGIVLDRELDVSRGDWLLAAADAPASTDDFDDTPVASPIPVARELTATVAWLDNEALVPGRVYWALHGHRWVKAKVRRIVHQVHIETLAETAAEQLPANAIGVVELLLQEPIAALPYSRSRGLGALVLVDTASHATSGAVMLN